MQILQIPPVRKYIIFSCLSYNFISIPNGCIIELVFFLGTACFFCVQYVCMFYLSQLLSFIYYLEINNNAMSLRFCKKLKTIHGCAIQYDSLCSAVSE